MIRISRGRETEIMYVAAAFDEKREMRGRHDNSAHFGIQKGGKN